MIINFPKTEFYLFIDVGLSHSAPLSVQMLQQNKNAFVIGIEPNPKNCNSVRSLNLGNRFHLIEAGVGNVKKGEVRFSVLNMLWPDPGTSSFLEVTDVLFSQGYKIENKVPVQLISLESILDSVPWELVSDGLFELKSDTQGFEVEVLLSLGKYISKIKNLTIESTTWGCYKDASSLDDIKAILDPHMIMTKCEGENAWFVKR